MATFKAGEESNYGGSGGSGFFQISQDGGTKQIRFLYNTMDDVEGMSVHKIKLGNKNRYVNCLRNYNDPKDMCPFCKDGQPVQARLIIPVYNIDDDQVQLWDRGKTMFTKMSSLCARYAANGKHLVGTIFEIERNGAPGDRDTTYEVYPIESDDSQLEDFPEPKKALGGLVLDKSASEMEYFLSHGDFPEGSEASTSSGSEEDVPVRRRGAERRTPANRHRGEVF